MITPWDSERKTTGHLKDLLGTEQSREQIELAIVLNTVRIHTLTCEVMWGLNLKKDKCRAFVRYIRRNVTLVTCGGVVNETA